MTKIRRQWTISLLDDAIKAQERFFDAWKNTEDITELTDQELKVAEKAFLKRIIPVHCFDMIVKVNKEKAIELLLSRYLGKGVSADTKYGGYESELNLMLDDLFESHGEEALSELLNSEDFDKEKLNDPRVSRSLGEALGIKDDEYLTSGFNFADRKEKK